MSWWFYLVHFFICWACIAFGMWHGRRIERKVQAELPKEPVHEHIWSPWVRSEEDPNLQTRQCFSCEFTERHVDGHQHEWGLWTHINLNQRGERGQILYTVSGQIRYCKTCGEAETREIK